MDKKIEEKIAKLAFGDLSEAEAAEVRAHAAANTDAAQALDSYETLRSDLRRLRDVPPDQLSKERLRNAILTQGLSPKPVRRGLPWVWVSTAGLAAAIAIVAMLRPMQSGTAVASYTAPSTTDIVQPLNPDDENLGSGINFDGNATQTQPVAETATAAPIQVASASDVKSEPVAMNYPVRHYYHLRYQPESYRGGNVVRPETDNGLIANAAASTVEAKPTDQPKKENETLVLIGSDKDSATGANSATEVHQTEDVIVSS